MNSKMKVTVLPLGASSLFVLVSFSVLLPGCQAVGCTSPVGIANSSIIPDDRFTASSYYNEYMVPKYARLNGAKKWAPKTTTDPNDYLQIDLGQVFVICAVATQGDIPVDYFVTEYKISTSVNNSTWTAYPSDASPKLFAGNTDPNTVVKKTLDPAVRVKFLRFIPTKYNGWKVLRVEAYEYAEPEPCNNSVCLNGGTCNGTEDDYNCSCHHGYTGKHCEIKPCNNSVCLNGGTCNGTEDDYNCSCHHGYTGKHCEIRFYGNFTFTMDLYQTSCYQRPYSPLAYPVVVYPNQPLWVQYAVKNTNADLVVFAENCRATTSTNPDSSPQHVFLEKGCVVDETMVYSHNPSSTVQRFSIRSFPFGFSNTTSVYLHCELIVCYRTSTNSRCKQGCFSSRRRREVDDGSKRYNVYAGPLKGPNKQTGADKQGGEETSSLLAVLLCTAMVLAVVTIVVLAIILWVLLKKLKTLMH